VHQEDSCQALGIDPENNQRKAKYEAFGGPTLTKVAALIDAWAPDGAAQLDALLDQLVFTVAIGNADAHGKNIALLHPAPGQISLAPLYDTVPTVMWPKLRTQAAMTVNGRTDLRQISLDDIAAEARRWSLDPIHSRARAADVCGRLLATLDADRINIDTPALSAVAERLRRLLSGSAK
jgi:serine/threonine-protein kinase HipA